MLEECLIKHCAPTLASLKTASVFTIKTDCEKDFSLKLETLNSHFNDKGIFLTILKHSDGNALVYVYRESCLDADLKKRGVGEFLMRCGYENADMAYAIERLKERLQTSGGFPHEIGIFLGYPLEDVLGFIKYGGKNCKLCGYWKVYCNVCETRKLFERIHKCREIYARLWREGRSVLQLTVAA
ncbi:MAG: DUF3793 family protein [Clostridia bacterium]|nr:DUF3793 family protein [Clostridia bacterium]